MRRFRSDRENFRDTRIAYTFLLSLAAVCAVMGILITSLGGGLREARVSSTYETLTLCADAVERWRNAEDEAAMQSAAVGFEAALTRLPSDVDADVLLDFARQMYDGTADDTSAAALHDTFALLGAIEYRDEAEARAIVSETVNRVGETLFAALVSATDRVQTHVIPPEVTHFAREVLRGSIADIVGYGASLAPSLSEDGDTFVAEADNLRMIFSAETGRLEEFLHIRIGDVPETVLTEDERIASAKKFACRARRCDGFSTESAREVCGILSVELTRGGEAYRLGVDRFGRVWNFIKVKR